jgi:hypothetical protein
MPGPRNTPDRFWSHVDRSAGEAACWPWTSTLSSTGYGKVTWHQVQYKAHRIAWFLTYGEMPRQTIDHLCRNPLCCNPSHMEDVPNGVNVLRGRGPSALNLLVTHCPRGHAYDEANTSVRISARGRVSRKCRACEAARQRELRARVRAVA